MRFYGFDWTYLVFILPCVLLSLFCQIRVSSAFSKYSQVPNSRRMTGAQAAEYVLRQNGVYGVRIEHVAGKLTDHLHRPPSRLSASPPMRQVTRYSTRRTICPTKSAAYWCPSRTSAPS